MSCLLTCEDIHCSINSISAMHDSSSDNCCWAPAIAKGYIVRMPTVPGSVRSGLACGGDGLLADIKKVELLKLVELTIPYDPNLDDNTEGLTLLSEDEAGRPMGVRGGGKWGMAVLKSSRQESSVLSCSVCIQRISNLIPYLRSYKEHIHTHTYTSTSNNGVTIFQCRYYILSLVLKYISIIQ